MPASHLWPLFVTCSKAALLATRADVSRTQKMKFTRPLTNPFWRRPSTSSSYPGRSPRSSSGRRSPFPSSSVHPANARCRLDPLLFNRMVKVLKEDISKTPTIARNDAPSPRFRPKSSPVYNATCMLMAAHGMAAKANSEIGPHTCWQGTRTIRWSWRRRRWVRW